MRRLLLSTTCAIALMTVGAEVVAAGELTGEGTSLKPLRANSECAFSGLDDADADGFEHTQNWGQLSTGDRAFLASIGLSPWQSCNGHLNPMRD